jgi:hypothetical protein
MGQNLRIPKEREFLFQVGDGVCLEEYKNP